MLLATQPSFWDTFLQPGVIAALIAGGVAIILAMANFVASWRQNRKKNKIERTVAQTADWSSFTEQVRGEMADMKADYKAQIAKLEEKVEKLENQKEESDRKFDASERGRFAAIRYVIVLLDFIAAIEGAPTPPRPPAEISADLIH